jgi:hypothetical protein
MTAKHPEIFVRLAGPAKDFSVLDHVARALRKAGVPAEEIDQFCAAGLCLFGCDVGSYVPPRSAMDASLFRVFSFCGTSNSPSDKRYR